MQLHYGPCRRHQAKVTQLTLYQLDSACAQLSNTLSNTEIHAVWTELWLLSDACSDGSNTLNEPSMRTLPTPTYVLTVRTYCTYLDVQTYRATLHDVRAQAAHHPKQCSHHVRTCGV
eukprot:352394-Chlamydomonas_euryale.AAC.5